MEYCRVQTCGALLILGVNWSPSNERRNNKICKSCDGARKKSWAQANPDRVKTATMKWRNANQERYKTINKKWRKDNSERIKLNGKRWRETHPEYWVDYYTNNSDRIKANVSAYKKTPKGKMVRKKHDASPKSRAARMKYQKTPEGRKRHNAASRRYEKTPKGILVRRAASSRHRKTSKGKLAKARSKSKRRFLYPLKTIWGKPLKGLVLHHVTKDTGVYIPEWLHRSIYHCLETGKNMDKINVAAMEFYERAQSKLSQYT